jgi:hypothetical protein
VFREPGKRRWLSVCVSEEGETSLPREHAQGCFQG